MGCDIHSRCEVKVNGKWHQNTELVFPGSHPPGYRNYDWFSILADVRNGRGFAGCITGDGFNVISEPRGVPLDCSEEWANYVEEWGCDLHSKSWLKVQDFESFDWDQKSIKQGVISFNYYKELINTGVAPGCWCGGVSGLNIETISMDDAKKHIQKPLPYLEGKEIYVTYRWEITYSDYFESEIKSWVDPMRKLLETYEDVRIVFGFDN